MTPNKNSIKYQTRTFIYAFKGLVFFFTKETKAWIHSIAALAVIISGLLLKFQLIDWCLVSFAIGFVIVCEIINSAIESIVDLISPEHHVLAGRAKDLAAGAVLFAAITAIAIAGFVYLPKIF